MTEKPSHFTPDELDAAFFAALTSNRQKLAMVAAKAKLPAPAWQDQKILDDAFERLARRPDVETFGDISNWRFSEICLKSGER